MHSKKQYLQSRQDLAPNKRLKSNISEFFLDGTISGARANSVQEAAEEQSLASTVSSKGSFEAIVH